MSRTAGDGPQPISGPGSVKRVAVLAFSAGLVGLSLLATATLAAADEPARSDAKAANANSGAPTAPAQLFKKLDTNNDGKIEKGEVPNSQRSLFDRLMRIGDADQNGSLDREEFIAGLKPKDAPAQPMNGKIADGSGPDVDPNNVFLLMDKNRDGKLVRDELPEPARERLGRMFDRLNTEEISKEQFLEQFKRMQEMMANGETPEKFGKLAQTLKNKAQKSSKPAKNKTVKQTGKKKGGEPGATPAGGPADSQKAMLFKRADTNGDGKLDKSEAPGPLKMMFDRIDANGDGAITEDELPDRPPGGFPPGGFPAGGFPPGGVPGASNAKRSKTAVAQVRTIKSPVLNVTALANVSDRRTVAKNSSPNGRKVSSTKGRRGVQAKLVRGEKRGGKGSLLRGGKGPGGKGKSGVGGKRPGGNGKGGIGGKGPGGKGPGGKGPGGKGPGGKGPGGKGPGGKGPGGKGPGGKGPAGNGPN